MAWVTAAGSQTLTAPAVLNLSQTSQLSYSYTCYLANGTPCTGSHRLPIAAQVGGGRLVANSGAVSNGVSDNCSSQISLATASAVFYSQLLCQLSNLIQSREDAQANFV
ncbi:hypothetical protein M0L20_02625 [Spirosoma sp. RP8]|uniref:Ig-like domain-containing protein n=1 Tax=Spirosoma liriopis TaxID=2937440 RepID=A0ABT0HEY9_9BACT|nr:hypothetical protein [Spirosoma liriopis]MCK8490729.1 hypothetical protein [Spirosoma liriopis]